MQTFCSFNHVQMGKNKKGRREKRCHLSSGALKQCQGRRYIKKQINFLYPWPAWHKWIHTQTVQTLERKTHLDQLWLCSYLTVTAETSARRHDTHLGNIQNKERYERKVASATVKFRSIYKAVADRFLQRSRALNIWPFPSFETAH